MRQDLPGKLHRPDQGRAAISVPQILARPLHQPTHHAVCRHADNPKPAFGHRRGGACRGSGGQCLSRRQAPVTGQFSNSARSSSHEIRCRGCAPSEIVGEDHQDNIGPRHRRPSCGHDNPVPDASHNICRATRHRHAASPHGHARGPGRRRPTAPEHGTLPFHAARIRTLSKPRAKRARARHRGPDPASGHDSDRANRRRSASQCGTASFARPAAAASPLASCGTVAKAARRNSNHRR